MKTNISAAVLALSVVLAISCKKEEDPPPPVPGYITMNFVFNNMQARLNNIGENSTIPAGNAAQSPRFNSISAHYVEMTTDKWTPVGDGVILYNGPETNAGGATAVDFDQALILAEGEEFISISVEDIPPGVYKYLRVSLTYQNYDIDLHASGLDLTGTLASFVGFNSYITSFPIKAQTLVVNDDRLQGFWAFETQYGISEGQAPPGATTVPNPLFATSPIPQGSCLVSGEFDPPLIVTGKETVNRTIKISLSTNNSFEWKDAAGNGLYEPLDGDTVVDMGLRGLVPIVE